MSDLICLSMLDATLLPANLVPESIHLTAADFSPSRRTSYMTGRALLAAWCQRRYDCPALPDMVTGPHGRPAFRDPGLPDFSISHSGDWLWLAVGEPMLGLDVEQQRRKLQRRRAGVGKQGPPTTGLCFQPGMAALGERSIPGQHLVEVGLGDVIQLSPGHVGFVERNHWQS